MVTLQEILTSHICELELPCMHNLSVHFIPHVTNLLSQQGFQRHSCIMESHKEVLVMLNLKAIRNIRHKLWQSLCSYFLEVIENVHESHAVYMAAECQNCDMTETGSDTVL